jgi:broad specificity phosphatase PhoE
MEIILARHGRPKMRQKTWIAPYQLESWIRAYDESGLAEQQIPESMRAIALAAGLIVSSPLPRCVQSAQALMPSRQIVTDILFREAELPFARWGWPRLPEPVWSVLFRVSWFLGFSANAQSVGLVRGLAKSAAARLIELARAHDSVFVMGHGIMSALIATELLRFGWKGPKRPGHSYWQFSVYRK